MKVISIWITCVKIRQHHREVLKTHKEVIHKGVKYLFNMFDYAATSKGNVRKHRKTFHEKYSCKMCDDQTGWKHYLASHKRSKHSSSTSSKVYILAFAAIRLAKSPDESYLAFSFYSFPSFSIFKELLL